MDDPPVADDLPGRQDELDDVEHLPAESLGQAYAETLRIHTEPDEMAVVPDHEDHATAPDRVAPVEPAPGPADAEAAPDDVAPPPAPPRRASAETTPPSDAQAEPERVRVTGKSILEAMLFVGGEPLSTDRACQLIRGMNTEKLRACVAELNDEYDAAARPFEIWDEAEGLVLQVKDAFIPAVKRLYKRQRDVILSHAALETLAVVAYQQPVGRAQIETIRGVSCAKHLRMLIARGLVRVAQRAESEGQPTQYGTADRFLDLFNLQSIDDLPRIDDLDRL